MAVDATHVYWVTTTTPGGSVIHKAALGGGAPVTLFTAPEGHHVTALVAAGAAVYWTLAPDSSGDGAVMKLPVEGGAP